MPKQEYIYCEKCRGYLSDFEMDGVRYCDTCLLEKLVEEKKVLKETINHYSVDNPALGYFQEIGSDHDYTDDELIEKIANRLPKLKIINKQPVVDKE